MLSENDKLGTDEKPDSVGPANIYYMHLLFFLEISQANLSNISILQSAYSVILIL
jgi:hypothetical protein